MNLSKEKITEIISGYFYEKELIEELTECAVTEAPPDKQLLKEGEYVSVVPLVLNGSVKVIRNDESGKEILLYNILDGESCALSISACISNSRSKAVAVTDDDTLMLLIPADKVRNWITRYTSWRDFVLNLYNLRFNELISAFDDVAFKHIDDRLIEKLKEKMIQSGTDTISVTHQQLANELGTAREVVSRLLKKLEKDGKIKNFRGSIKIFSLM